MQGLVLKDDIMKKKICIFVLFVLFSGIMFSQEEVLGKQGWSYNLVSDFVYYPKTDYVTGDNHFAPITGAFDNFQNRERFHAVYTKFTPLGTNPLLQYANIKLDLGFEATLIDAGPMISISFMPHPLLILSAGGMFCAGWSLGPIDSISVLNKETKGWNGLKPFVNNYYDFWASATLQFDTGAIIPGEWSHVIMSASYKVIYKGMTGMTKGDIWSWQGEPNYTNGFQYYQSYMLGYHFPTGPNFLGVISNLYGFYDNSIFGNEFANYKADFMKIDIDPVIEFLIGDHTTLDFLFDFSSRRSFAENHSSMKDELYLTTTGREWYLRGIIISWIYKF